MLRLPKLPLLLALGVFLATAPAAAADDEDAARRYFAAGVEAFGKSDFAGALELFERADQAHHAPTITYNIARTRESLGQAQAAVDAYEAYITEAGGTGEFASAAVVAVVQIKERCTRLRVTSEPPNARVFVDGVETRERSPTSVLLFSGPHRLAIELGDWKDGKSYRAAGGGATDEVQFTKPTPRPVAADKPRAPTPAPQAPRVPAKDNGPVLDGLMGGVGLSAYGYRFVGDADKQSGNTKTTADEKPTGVVFGLEIDLGWALSRRTALLLRGFGGLGTAEGELASLLAGGPALSFRLGRNWWAGGGVIFGGSRADSDATRRSTQAVATAKDDQLTYRTDFAFGPELELSYALAENPAGQWVVSLMPSGLFTTLGKQSTLFVPIVLGHRWF